MADTRSGRLCIGIAIDDIVMVGGYKAWTGACAEAHARGVDLVCLRSSLYGDTAEFPPVWDLIPRLDGIVVYQPWPSVASFEAFRSRYPNARMVNAVRLYEGCPGFTPDSFGGMQEMVRHFIDVHGYRKIAFVAGPEGNWSADERLRAYRETLKERGLRLDERLITGHYGWGDGFVGVRELMDTRGLKPGVDFEAILAPNDSMAFSIMDELRNRQVPVPETVAVAGFDNDVKASFSNPTLTTTGYDVGRHATKVLVDWLEGARVPDKTLIPAHPVIRRSCGCRDARVVSAGAVLSPPSVQERAKKGLYAPLPDAARSTVLDSIAEILRRAGFSETEGTGAADAFQDAFEKALEADAVAGSLRYLDELYRLVPRVPAGSEGPVVWQDALSVQRRELGKLFDPDTLSRAEALWHEARLLVAEAGQVWMASAAARRRELDLSLRALETALMTTFSMASLEPVLKAQLPRLGVQRAWLWLQEGATGFRLLFTVGGEGGPPPEKVFPADDVLGQLLLPSQRQNLLVEPLSFQGQALGFVVFALGPFEADIYTGLRATLSSAIQGALLIENIQGHASQIDRIVANTVTASEDIQRIVADAARQSHEVLEGAEASMAAGKAGQQAVQDTISGIELIRDRVGVIAASIQELSARVLTVAGLIESIENIIGLTDVLAINASIQAARAGEKGLGFAVVAKEMRALAEQSRSATSNVGALLAEIRNAAENAVKVTDAGMAEAEKGRELAGRAGITIRELSDTITAASDAARAIRAGTERQEAAILDLVSAVRAIKAASTGP